LHYIVKVNKFSYHCIVRIWRLLACSRFLSRICIRCSFCFSFS